MLRRSIVNIIANSDFQVNFKENDRVRRIDSGVRKVTGKNNIAFKPFMISKFSANYKRKKYENFIN